jgi:hypothetical protein
MCTFHKFPREIRDIIYQYSLSVPHTLIPYNPPYNHQHRADNPAIALLSVNKAVRQEALPILIRCNSWFISDHLNEVAAKDNTGSSDYRRVSTKPLPRNALESTMFYKYRDLFRSIELDFSNHHWLMYDCPSLRWAQTLELHNQDAAHMAYLEIAVARWTIQNRVLAMMPNLEELVLDIQDCSCPGSCSSGCCRMRVLRLIFEDIMKTTVAKDVRVVLRDPKTEAEKELVKMWRDWGLNEGETGLFFTISYDEDDIHNDFEGEMEPY